MRRRRLNVLFLFMLGRTVSAGGGDTCADAPVTLVSVGPVGSPLTTIISGDNTNATCDSANCPPGTELGWYEAIEIDRCARITIDFCGQDPVLRPSYAALFQTCPISGDLVIFRDSASRTEPCTDFNLWMEFNEVPAGRYWFPIYTIPGAKTCENGTPATCNSDDDCPDPYTCQDNLHPYTMNITAEALFDAESSRIPPPEARHRPPSSLKQAGPGGPDIIVSDVFGCVELGREGPFGSGIVGMACGTTACNIGTQSAAWSALPDLNHPLISLNLFRLSTPPGNGGADRFMQVGRSWLKHGYFAENTDECNAGCNPVCEGGSNAGGSCSFDEHCPSGTCQGTIERLAPACADTYVAQQFVPCDLGPRSMVHPFTGEMPPFVDLGPSPGCVPLGVETHSAPANDHRDHVHTEISHRLQIADSDLDPHLHPGAQYFAEGQYIVPQEFVDGNGNQFNNVSYRPVVLAGDPSCGGVFFEDTG